VRWYFRFQLGLCDIEEVLFERGIVVSYETVRRWCDKFGAGYAHQVKAARRKTGTTWHLDEVFHWPTSQFLLPLSFQAEIIAMKNWATVVTRLSWLWLF